MTPTPRPALRFWPSVSLSLAIHAALAALLLCRPAPSNGNADGGPLAVDVCTMDAEHDTKIPVAMRALAREVNRSAPAGPQPVPVVPTLTPPPEPMVSAASSRIIPAFMHEDSVPGVGLHTEPSRGASGGGSGTRAPVRFPL